MSGKSNALKQENIKLKKRINAFERLIRRIDQGAAALRDIAVMYGRHLESCPKHAAGEESEAACSCQWDQALAMMTYRPQQTPEQKLQAVETFKPAEPEVPTP